MIERLRRAARGRPDDADDDRIRRDGYPGRGTVVSVAPTGRTDRDHREVELILDVYLGRSRTFRVEIRPWITEPQLARLQPGEAVPVAADHDEPGHVVLAFEMDDPVSIAGLGPIAGGPGGPLPIADPVSPSPEEPAADR
jgi:hypothetical protein